jgi:hypothetical protein
MMTVLVTFIDGTSKTYEWDMSLARVRAIDEIVRVGYYGVSRIEILRVLPSLALRK